MTQSEKVFVTVSQAEANIPIRRIILPLVFPKVSEPKGIKMWVKNLLNGTHAWTVIALHTLAWYSYQAQARNSIAEAIVIVQHFSPYQLVIFSETFDKQLPQQALEIISHAATFEFPLES